jgi:DNA-binding FadR family transcriptional regulator
MLAAEGFVKARPGSGSFVRQRPERQSWLKLAPGREVPASTAAAGTAAPR